jgi:hypothetical protein
MGFRQKQEGQMAGTVKTRVVVWIAVVAAMVGFFGCASGPHPTPQTQPAPDIETAAVPQRAGETEVGTQQSADATSEPDASAPAADLTLRFVPGPTIAYTAVVEQGKSVTWGGAPEAKPAGFNDGRTDNRTEVTFEQKVLSVDEAGNAAVEITIRALKHVNRITNEVKLDFDSTRQADAADPLARLIGQSYRIKLSRRGEVLEVVDAVQARAVVAGDSPSQRMGQRFLSDPEIKDRHTIAALAGLNTEPVRVGQSWSSIRGFSFSWMGSKSFERIYTLKEASESAGRRTAVVEMKAIPSAAQTREPQIGGPFAGMYDNTANYEGRLVFDLESGQVRASVEQMHTEWIIADPTAIQDGSAPAAVRMAATWRQELEQVE